MRRSSQAGLAGALLLLPLLVRAELVDRVAAVVNNDIITLSELQKRAAPEMTRVAQESSGTERGQKQALVMKKALDAMIDEKLVDSELRELKVSISDKEVDAAVEEVKKSYNLTDEQLSLAVAKEGLTLNEYREQMRKQIARYKLINEKVRKNVKVSDADVKSEYDRMTRSEGEDYEVHVRHILISVPRSAPPPQVEEARRKATAIAAEARQPGVELRRAGEEAERGQQLVRRRRPRLLQARHDGPGVREGGVLPEDRRGIGAGTDPVRLARAEAGGDPEAGHEAPRRRPAGDRGAASPAAGRAAHDPVHGDAPQRRGGGEEDAERAPPRPAVRGSASRSEIRPESAPRWWTARWRHPARPSGAGPGGVRGRPDFERLAVSPEATCPSSRGAALPAEGPGAGGGDRSCGQGSSAGKADRAPAGKAQLAYVTGGRGGGAPGRAGRAVHRSGVEGADQPRPGCASWGTPSCSRRPSAARC